METYQLGGRSQHGTGEGEGVGDGGADSTARLSIINRSRWFMRRSPTDTRASLAITSEVALSPAALHLSFAEISGL